MKNFYKIAIKTLKFLIIFSITVWLFSGWPQISGFPPKIQKARAATETIRPTDAYVFEAWTTPGNGYDGNTNTSASFTDVNKVISISFGGNNATEATNAWASKGQTWTAATLYLTFSKTAGSNDTVAVTINDEIGTIKHTIVSSTAGEVTKQEFSQTLSSADWGGAGFPNIANIRVRVSGVKAGGPDGATAYMYDVRIDGAYTATTFLGNDTNPGVNPTIAPGAATTTVDTFNLKASFGTNTVTNATTTLATGTGTSTVAVLITNSANTTTYCTVYNPTSDVVGLTGCNLPVTTASTTFNVRIKPLTHSAMPAPPGGAYAVTALITAITATTTTSGTDTTSDTVTIDNQSPSGATSTDGTAGNQKVTLNWTASGSGDFDTSNGSVILRWASGSAGSEVPAEGNSSYSAGNTITTATVACVISSAASASLIKIDGSGGDAGCTTSVLTNGQQYTYVAFQRDTNGNYDAGASIGTFTPVAGLTLAQNNYRIYENKDAIQPDYALGSENASSTVAQGEAFRIRMSLTIGGSDLASSTKRFKLQFNTASSTTGWIDVGKIASTSAIFRGYDNGSVSNNATPTAVLLSTSIKRGTYQEQWLSDLGHEGANIGQDIEYDWVILEQSATTSINYYFRMINSNDTVLDNYINQAIVTVKPRTYTQNNYQWFANLDSLTPGSSLNQINTGISLVTNSDIKRLRIDMTVGTVGLATSSKKFKLEYKTLGGGCEVAESWTAVGAIGSGEIWRGYNNASVSDGATTTSVYLNSANRFETYEEENNTASSTSRIELGQYGEYDWVIQDNSAPLDTTYCFRMATTTGGAFNTYNNYPRLITANYQPTTVAGGSAAEISPAGPYQTPTTTPSGGAPAESSPSGVYQVPTTTPSGGGGDSGYAPMMKFFADIGYFFASVFLKLFYALV